MPGNDSSFRYLNDNIVLFPDWIAESTESYLLDKYTNAPKSKFVTLSNRRLQLWGCQPASDSANESTPMIYQKLPDYLHSLAEKIDRLGILSAIPNQCLANEYLCKQGIMPHEDGPIFYPNIATVNLGCHTVLNLYKKSLYDQVTSTTPSFSIFLPPRSLLILKGEIYENYLHGIEERSTDLLSPSSIINWEMLDSDSEEIVKERESTRVSLTFRVAKKVSKLSFLNFK